MVITSLCDALNSELESGERGERALGGLLFLGIGILIFVMEHRQRRLEALLYSTPDSVKNGDTATAIRELEELRPRTREWTDALAERVLNACAHDHPELAHALLDHFKLSVDALWYKAPLEVLSIDEEAERFHLDYLREFAAERRRREATPPPADLAQQDMDGKSEEESAGS